MAWINGLERKRFNEEQKRLAEQYMSGNGDQSANSIGIAYDAIVSPVSEAVVNASVASVLFVICWDAV